MPKERICCVEWEDAAYNSGFYDKRKSEDFDPVFTRSVGHFIRSTKKAIILSMERFYDVDEKKVTDDRHITTIPKKMIRRIRYLKEVSNESTDKEG